MLGDTGVGPALISDSDPQSDPLTTGNKFNPNGTVAISDHRTLSFTPENGFVSEAPVNHTIYNGKLRDPAVLFVKVPSPKLTAMIWSTVVRSMMF